jgi:uncharacterized membrane protein YgcG
LRQIYVITILILGAIIVSGSIGNMVAYGIIDGSGTNNHPFNQTTYNGCSTFGRAYYEGFVSGCITGQGKDYFSCQRITNLAVPPEEYDSGSSNNSDSNYDNSGGGGASSFGGGGGGSNGHGGGGSSFGGGGGGGH